MGRLLIFNFDGTGNEPEDAHHETNSITNILKLHLMLQGNLFQEGDKRGHSELANIKRCFYYQGIGTYGSKIKRALNQSLSLEQSDVVSILNQAMYDFKTSYTNQDVVLVTGFSRGAALARRFVSLVAKEIAVKNIEPFVFLCVFDTVASFGFPDLSTTKRPKFDVLFENGNTLDPIVKQALHMVSLDEKRRAFQPTLMNYEPNKIVELWFAGNHSDIGGGYQKKGLSDITLDFTFKWLNHMSKTQALPTIEYVELSQSKLNKLLPNDLQNIIDAKSLQPDPDSMGNIHQQQRWRILNWLTLDDRICCVIENDNINSQISPTVHPSVLERIDKDKKYRPKSLKNTPYTVWSYFVHR